MKNGGHQGIADCSGQHEVLQMTQCAREMGEGREAYIYCSGSTVLRSMSGEVVDKCRSMWENRLLRVACHDPKDSMSRKLQIVLPQDQAIPFLGIYPNSAPTIP